MAADSQKVKWKMADEMLRAGKILLWVWYQYGHKYKNPEGVVYLDHLAMSAGEEAAEWLVELGLCIGPTRKCGITKNGLRLMDLKDCLGYDEFLANNQPGI